MTFPSSGALSAANINSQFNWPAGRAVSLADPAIVGTGGNATPGTSFSYSNLYNNSPKWLFAYSTATAIAYATAARPSSFGNGATFLSMYYNQSDSYTYIVRSYINGNILSTYRTNFSSGAVSIGTDSSNNIYINYGNTIVKYNSSFTQVASAQWTYGGSTGFDSTVFGGETQAGHVGNSIYASGTFNGIPLLTRLNSSLVGQWTLRTNTAGPAAGNVYPQYPIQDSAENCYMVLSAFNGTTGYNAVAKINSSGSVVFNVAYGSLGYQYNNFQHIGVNAAGTAIGLVGNYLDQPSLQTGFSVGYMNGSGSLQWARTLYIASSWGYAGTPIVAIDDITGDLYAMAALNASNTTFETYIVKYNSSGTLQWTRKWYGEILFGSQWQIQPFGFIFADGVLRASLVVGYPDGYGGLTTTGTYTWQVPLDGSGTGTYTLLSGQTIYYAAGSLTAVSKSPSAVSAVCTFSSVTSSYAAVTATVSASSSTGTLSKI